MNNKNREGRFWRWIDKLRSYRLTLLVALALFVFSIVCVTIFIGLVLFFVLLRLEFFVLTDVSKLLLIIVILLIASIVISTGLTVIFGRHPLRLFSTLTEAARQIAMENFDVQVPVRGTVELRNLAESFNAMARDLAGIETLRNDFIDNAAHEFKTPVNSIKGFARLLKKEDLTHEQRLDYVDVIIRETQRLCKLSGNVLLLSKLEHMVEIEDISSFSLDEQIRLAVLSMESQWQIKNIGFNIDLEAIWYTGSEELLYQAWVNLIENAVKFSPENSEVSISLKKADNAVHISISDQGPGIPAADRKHIFEQFFQSDQSHGADGNGLGLSLVRKIIRISGGTIEVASGPGEGASFTIALPLK